MAFDFYDDWDQDESEWGNDELDRLLSGDDTAQPGKHGGMSYGSRGVGRRKGGESEDDVNMVPKSSMFGFLESLPWKIGGRGVRYKPNVANLQDNVGRRGMEAEPLMEEGGEREERGHRRSRSGTVGSRSTTNSLSSRGDLFPSDDEDDAVPLDDEFAMALERRTTGTMSDDHSDGKRNDKRPSGSGASTKTVSSRDTKNAKRDRRGTSPSSRNTHSLIQTAEEDVPSITDLKHEEELVQQQEEAEVEQRRHAAQRLALERGLSSTEDDEPEVTFPAQCCWKYHSTDRTQDTPGDHDVKEGAIIHNRELHLLDHNKDSPLANSPPPELPSSNAESGPPTLPQSQAQDGAPEPKPPTKPNN